MTTASPMTLHRAKVLRWLWISLGARLHRGISLPAPVVIWYPAVAARLRALGPYDPTTEAPLARWVRLLAVPGCPVLPDGTVLPSVLAGLEVPYGTAA